MSFYMYMLRCSDDSYYTGHTDELDKRVEQHNAGEDSYTKSRLPVELVFSESFGSRDQAFAAERQVKGWSRAKKEALIRGDWAKMKDLARSYSRRKATE